MHDWHLDLEHWLLRLDVAQSSQMNARLWYLHTDMRLMKLVDEFADFYRRMPPRVRLNPEQRKKADFFASQARKN